MKELLKIFCTKDDNREVLKTPFNQDVHTYATDGRICIRVNQLPGYEFKENAPKDISKNLFNDIPFEKLVYENLPEIKEIQFKKCPDCGGTGKNNTCTVCDGLGDVFCESDSCMGHDCCECDGTGKVSGNEETCEECNGNGKIVDAFAGEIINGKKISLINLNKIKQLLNVKICVTHGSLVSMIPFVFDNGQGLVMPLRLD